MTLETQVMNIESAAQNAETFKVMNPGKNAMVGVRVSTYIEKVEVDKLMDEIKEEMEAAATFSSLEQPIDPLLTNEDDLLAKLDQMSADAALGAPVVNEQAFPTAPNKKMPGIANASKKRNWRCWRRCWRKVNTILSLREGIATQEKR